MKFFSELPLARKLILTMMATSSSALLVACLLFLSYDVISLRQSITGHLNSLADITGANVAAALAYNDPKSADLVLQALHGERHIAAARIYDDRGRAFASYKSVFAGPAVQLPHLVPAIGGNSTSDHMMECRAIVLDGEAIGFVYLVSDLQEIQARSRRFVVFMLILMTVSSVAAFLVALLLKRTISRPILDLAEAAKTVSQEKNFAVRAPKYASDELGLLADGFNEMLSEIEERDETIRAAHAESELFINAVPSILIGTDSAGLVTRWNLAAETTFGMDSKAVLGRPLQSCGVQWLSPRLGAEADSWFRVMRSERCDVTFERDGRKHVLGLTIITVNRFPTGEGIGFLITGADITERILLEEQLRQAQKLEAIGQLAAGIAHEINTPTQYIGDNSRFLKESWPAVSEILGLCLRAREESQSGPVTTNTMAELLQSAERGDLSYTLSEIPRAIDGTLEGVARVSKIVRAMKEFSHPGSEGKSAVNLNHAIETTVAVARNEWKYVADVETCFDESLPLVPCLAGEFNQVILNLLINAAHAVGDAVGRDSGRKGTITVTTRCVGDWVEVQIRDTGIGIPENIRARIFEPFFTTKEVGKGTGQGLALAHAFIVKKHKGQIWFESEVGKGTTFFLRLPLGPCETIARPATANS